MGNVCPKLCATVETTVRVKIYIISKWEYCVNGEMKPHCQPVDESNRLSDHTVNWLFFLSFTQSCLTANWLCSKNARVRDRFTAKLPRILLGISHVVHQKNGIRVRVEG